MNLKEIVNQLKSCEYECIAGKLENNVAFIELEKMAMEKSELLCLGDLQDFSEDRVREHLLSSYQTPYTEIIRYDILIAYESVGDWGCDSSSFFLLKEKETGDYYVNHGSHCSCFGFEGQFSPEKTTLEYLKSKHFSFCTGGYDNLSSYNETAVKSYINKL